MNISLFQMASDLMNPVQCNICENASAKFNCNTCGDVLCAICKTYHLKSKGTRDHKVVPYAEKLNPKYIAQLFCSTHRHHAPKFWCDTCGVPICDSCVTNEHRGHQCNNITDVLTEKRDAMLAEMKMIRDTTMAEWKEVLKQAQTITTEYIENIDKIDKELVARAQEMHREVDIILLRRQQTLKEIKESGLGKLQDQEKYIRERLQQLQEDVQRYEDQLVDSDPNALLQFQQGMEHSKDEQKSFSLETISLPIFTKGQGDNSEIQNMFGQLSTQVIPKKSREIPYKYSDTELALSELTNSATKRSLIQKPYVQSQFSADQIFPYIACVNQGQAWVYTQDVTLQLMDRDGTVQDTIKTNFDIDDMAVTSDGDILLADLRNKCIKSVSGKKTISTLFNTSGRPYSLCCLHNNNIVVTFCRESKVIMYSRSGEIIQAFNDHIKFRYPMSVAVNKVNQNIYVCDHEENCINSTGKVMTIGTDGQLLYEYSGQDSKNFYPVKICTDLIGHIFITDLNNHCIHILDQEGKFVQYVLTSEQGLNEPTIIDVDSEGYVWVAEFYNRCVKVASYLH